MSETGLVTCAVVEGLDVFEEDRAELRAGFSPTSGAAATVVTISGIGFNTGSTVKFNGTAATTITYVSSTELQATVTSTATTGPITVTNSTGVTGTVTSANSFTKT